MTSPCELLSHRQRELTPRKLAIDLVSAIRESSHFDAVAALWVAEGTEYLSIAGCDCWGILRDAKLYRGPYPIIAHPPCGPWAKLRNVCYRQSKLDGIVAMHLVHTWGGVVEQPEGSRLFSEYGQPGHTLVKIMQCMYGHFEQKPTVLYFHTGMLGAVNVELAASRF